MGEIDTLIFDVNKFMKFKKETGEYQGVSRETVEPYNGQEVVFEGNYGKVYHPEDKGYLYPVLKEHCINQMVLF